MSRSRLASRNWALTERCAAGQPASENLARRSCVAIRVARDSGSSANRVSISGGCRTPIRCASLASRRT